MLVLSGSLVLFKSVVPQHAGENFSSSLYFSNSLRATLRYNLIFTSVPISLACTHILFPPHCFLQALRAEVGCRRDYHDQSAESRPLRIGATTRRSPYAWLCRGTTVELAACPAAGLRSTIVFEGTTFCL